MNAKVFFSLLSLTMIASSPVVACDNGLKAFESTVFAKVRRDCVKCHDGRRPDAPAFAVPDAFKSYDHLLNYMSFPKTDESLLVIRAGNGHCGEDFCDVPSGIEMQRLAAQWWESGEKTCGRNGVYFTDQVDLKDIPTVDKGFKTLEFDLGRARAEMAGVMFRIDVQDYHPTSEISKGAFRVRNPRFTQGTGSVYVKDVKVLLNGKFDSIYNAFSGVNNTFPFFKVAKGPAKTATTVLSGHDLIILKDGLTNPKLSLSFVDLQKKSDPMMCDNDAIFSERVAPVMKDLKCQKCHDGSGDAVSTQIFDCDAKDMKARCQVAKSLVDPKFPMASALFFYPLKGVNGHPQIADAERTKFVEAVQTWIKK